MLEPRFADRYHVTPWSAALAGKTDLIPGQINRTWNGFSHNTAAPSDILAKRYRSRGL